MYNPYIHTYRAYTNEGTRIVRVDRIDRERERERYFSVSNLNCIRWPRDHIPVIMSSDNPVSFYCLNSNH